jgi:hypothetical protein
MADPLEQAHKLGFMSKIVDEVVAANKKYASSFGAKKGF